MAGQSQQLARTRRNQQRCRERKRAHVAELESQVEALQAKIRQCEPCASPSPTEHESALDTATRENAARRDLLQALGFDDDTQQRFIKSTAKRQAVYTILQGDYDRTSPSQTPGERLAESPLVPCAQSDAQSLSMAAESADLRLRSGQTMDSLNTNTELTDVAINSQAYPLDPAVSINTRQSHKAFAYTYQIENWLFSPETIDKLPPSLTNPSSEIPWLTEPYNSYANFVQGAVNAVEPTDSTLTLEAMPNSSMDSLGNGLQGTSITFDNNQSVAGQAIERCFLDTVVQFQPGETSTVCSKALSQIFRHNRKGLPIAELQKQLKPGMRAPSGASGECRIEDSVLFKVLAEIST